MNDDERKRRNAFAKWSNDYVDKWHPKQYGKDKQQDYHRPAVIAALGVAFSEFFEPMLQNETEPDEEE